MSPETIEALTGLVQALAHLVEVMGAWPFGIVVIALAAIVLGVPTWREHLRNKRAMEIVNHKEREVERLAADNRRYREVYLARLGVPDALLQADRADSEKASKEREEAK
jgi:hypothetical protein